MKKTLKYLLDNKLIVELKPGDVSAKTEDQISKDDNGNYNGPVYAVPGIGEQSTNTRNVTIHGKDGKDTTLTLVNEGGHMFDANYQREHFMKSDAEITKGKNTIDQANLSVPDENKERYEQLLKYVSEAAAKDGNTEILVVKKDSPFTEVLQSKEGTNYIILQEAELQWAARNSKNMDEFKGQFDRENLRIQKGELSPENIVAGKEARNFIDQTGFGDDGIQHLPSRHTPLGNATLEELEKNGRIKQIDRSELMPNALNSELFDNDNKSLPIYVVPMGTDLGDKQFQKRKTSEGKEFILINEGYHQWTEDYVRQNKMMSDEQVNGLKESGDYTLAKDFTAKLAPDDKMQQRFEELARYIEESAKKAGLGDVSLYITGKDTENGSPLSASTTAEGKNFILIAEEELRQQLTTDKGLQTLKELAGHEIFHLKDGDMTPKGVNNNRDVSVARYQEAIADIQGQVIAGKNNLASFEDRFKEAIKENIKDYIDDFKDSKDPKVQLSSTTNPTDADYKKVSDWMAAQSKTDVHPALWDRILEVRATQQRMAEYEALHPVVNTSPESNAKYREEEAKYVIPKVMEDMKGKWQLPIKAPDAVVPEPKSPEPKKTVPQHKNDNHGQSEHAVNNSAKPPHGLNTDQMKDIAFMRNSMAHMGSLKMNDAETIKKDHSVPAKSLSTDGAAIRV